MHCRTHDRPREIARQEEHGVAEFFHGGALFLGDVHLEGLSQSVGSELDRHGSTEVGRRRLTHGVDAEDHRTRTLLLHRRQAGGTNPRRPRLNALDAVEGLSERIEIVDSAINRRAVEVGFFMNLEMMLRTLI